MEVAREQEVKRPRLQDEKAGTSQPNVNIITPTKESQSNQPTSLLVIDDSIGMTQLGSAVLQLLDSFSTGDVMASHPVLTISDSNGAEHVLELPFRPYIKQEADNFVPSAELKVLLDASEVSPFGHGKETKIDPSVRKARHIPADRIVDVQGIDLDAIVQKAKDVLFTSEDNVTAQLLKLNIYQEGDFFVPHRDTPLSKHSVGSLVIALPCAHVGGKLIVAHRLQTAEYNFAKDMENSGGNNTVSEQDSLDHGYYTVSPESRFSWLGPSPDLSKAKVGLAKPLVSWAAFYGDAEHEIQRVEQGVRLTLSYQLLRQESGATNIAPLKTIAPAVEESKKGADASEGPAAVVQQQTEETEARNNYSKMTIPELKELCRRRDLKVSGTKPQLIERLLHQQTGAVRNVPKEYIPDELACRRAQQLVKAFQEVLSSDSFYSDGCLLGFPCFHLYESDEDLPKEEDLTKQVTTQQLRLRGADSMLAMIAARLGVKVRVVRLAVFDDSGDGTVVPVDILPTVKNARLLGKVELIQEEFRSFGINLEDKPFKSQNIDFELDEVAWVFGIEGYIDGHMHADIPLAPILECFMGTGYFGNEAWIGTVYSQASNVFYDVES
eukprot:gene34647-41959_t